MIAVPDPVTERARFDEFLARQRAEANRAHVREQVERRDPDLARAADDVSRELDRASRERTPQRTGRTR